MTDETLKTDVKALYEHASSVLRGGNLPYAAQLLEKTAQAGHAFYSVFALTMLTDVYKRLGKADRELQVYKRLTDLPEDQKLLLDPRWVATCYLKTGDLQSAKSWYLKILELSPDDPDTAAGIAELSLLDGNSNEALSLAEKLAQRPEPKYQIVGRFLKALGLALTERQADSAKELLWLGQYIISLGNVPGDLTWDFRDTQGLVDKRGPNAKMTSLLIEVISRRMTPADFARAWSESVAVPR